MSTKIQITVLVLFHILGIHSADFCTQFAHKMCKTLIQSVLNMRQCVNPWTLPGQKMDTDCTHIAHNLEESLCMLSPFPLSFPPTPLESLPPTPSESHTCVCVCGGGGGCERQHLLDWVGPLMRKSVWVFAVQVKTYGQSCRMETLEKEKKRRRTRGWSGRGERGGKV